MSTEWTGFPCEDPELLDARQEAEYRHHMTEQQAEQDYERAHWDAWAAFCEFFSGPEVK